MRSLRRSSALLASSLVLVPLAACEEGDAERVVDIQYRHVANCYKFDSNPSGPHTVTPSGGGIFMVYRIDQVETRSQAFAPKRAKFFVGDKTQNAAATSVGHHATLKQEEIGPGTVATDLGWIIVNVAGPDPDGMATESQKLRYDNLDADDQVDPPMLLTPRADAPDVPALLDPCYPGNIPA